MPSRSACLCVRLSVCPFDRPVVYSVETNKHVFKFGFHHRVRIYYLHTIPRPTSWIMDARVAAP